MGDPPVPRGRHDGVVPQAIRDRPEVAAGSLPGHRGGDCWGCIGEIEGDPEYGYPPAIRKVQREIASGLRPASGRLRPAGGLDED